MPADNVLIAVDGSGISERAVECYSTTQNVCQSFPYRDRRTFPPPNGSFRPSAGFASHMYKPDHDVTLLHVAVPPQLHGYAAMGAACSMPVDEATRTIHEHVRIVKKLEEVFESKLRDMGITGRVVAVGHHNPCDAIVRYAEDNNIGLVVLGSRGHGTLRRTLMGSVSSYCLHHCSMPVVIIPPQHRY